MKSKGWGRFKSRSDHAKYFAGVAIRSNATTTVKGKGTVPELIPDLGSQPAGDVSHKPGGRLPLLSARPAVTLATLKRAANNLAAR